MHRPLLRSFSFYGILPAPLLAAGASEANAGWWHSSGSSGGSYGSYGSYGSSGALKTIDQVLKLIDFAIENNHKIISIGD